MKKLFSQKYEKTTRGGAVKQMKKSIAMSIGFILVIALAFYAVISTSDGKVKGEDVSSSDAPYDLGEAVSEASVESEKDNINYTLQAVVRTISASGSDGAGYDISLTLEMDTDDRLEVASSPVIASDADLENVLSPYNVSFNDYVFDISVTVDEIPENLYVLTPFATVTHDTDIYIDNVDNLGVSYGYSDSVGRSVVSISFTADDLDVIPNEATLKSGIHTLSSLYVNQNFDEDGNFLIGEIVFVNPTGDTLSSDYTLNITESHIIVERDIITVQLK